MNTSTLTYHDGETPCIGFLAHPNTGRSPGVLVAHEGPGLNDYARRRTEMIAELGFIGLALDLYGEGRLSRNPEESMALMTPLRENPARLRARVRAGFDALLQVSDVDSAHIGAIGYCFGGLAVLELARSGAPVAATVTFHGLLQTKTPEDAKTIQGKILVCTGADDPFVPPNDVAAFQREMSQANIDWQLITYGGAKHGFTNPAADRVGREALAYNPTADARSWATMAAFLSEVLHGGGLR